MHDTTLQLAALRLAPVQALSLGHPETSGLPSIDYFLSGELMEPPAAETHYTERLVRLPNLGIHYAPPPVAPAALTRRDVGLRTEGPVYWCCQALHKYQPQHDSIFPRIAKLVKDCQFVFLRHANGAGVNNAFEERLTAAFAGHGLSIKDCCVFLPPLDFAHFNAVARLCDVYLDSIGWTGFNSLLETLVWDIPPVILPGPLMRGRHSAAVMTMMGLSDLLAKDVDAYVGLAARLGADPELRRTVSARIRENKHKAFGDMAAVRGLEDFIVRVTEQSQAYA
jgi:predicted O-linked N-acetylglucosamine transferase (SPINDLY family)